MTKTIFYLPLFALTLTVMNCVSGLTLNKRSGYVPLAEAEYTIGGETVGKATVNYYFGIPSGEPTYGRVGNIQLFDSRATQMAKFDALSKVQGATSFMITDINIDKEGSILSYTKTATVKGRAITYIGPAR